MNYSADDISFDSLGAGDKDFLIFWAHGWGHNKKAFSQVAESLQGVADSILIDLPGFGDSPKPESVWGVDEYASSICSFVDERSKGKKAIWVGHSFGGSVGVGLAGSFPETLDGLVLVASAGLRTERPLAQRVKVWIRVRTFKLLKRIFNLLGRDTDSLYAKFGSPDYKQSGEMRQILVRTLNQDLSAAAQKISCPTVIIYGEKDTATPPAVGQRYSTLIDNSEFVVLDTLDHYTLLSTGRHQVAKRIKQLIEGL